MSNYGLNTKMNTPDLIYWAQKVNERNAEREKQYHQNIQNMEMMAGLLGSQKWSGNSDVSVSDYYSNWNDWSPEDQIALVNAGYNPSISTGRLNGIEDTNNLWGNAFGV